jgi:hypothetical protein
LELAEWEKLSEEEKLSIPQHIVMDLPRSAAKELIKKGHWDAESVYIGDRFGETLLWVFIDDENYIEPYPNRLYKFYGFRIVFMPLRHKFNDLESYENDLYFCKHAQ